MTTTFPKLDSLGLDGVLVRFADRWEARANRAALALRAALEAAPLDGVEETSSSLVSVYLRFDPLAVDLAALHNALKTRLAERDWYEAPLPAGRKLVRVPTCYAPELAPDLDQVAGLAGVDRAAAEAELSSTRVVVTTLGFAPGQPYLGALPQRWDIPRLASVTPMVPAGALVLAIRQFVLFANAAPTGWRHVGQTAVRLFQPGGAEPFLLNAGDEVLFPSVSRAAFDRLSEQPDGGVTTESLTS